MLSACVLRCAALLLSPAAHAADTPPVADALQNGDFGIGADGEPASWQRMDDAGATLKWEPRGGIDDSPCLSVSAQAPSLAAWRQSLQLAPYTPYLLTGYLRGEGLSANGDRPASLGVTLWRAETGPPRETQSLDWTPFELDFATDPAGRVDVLCKLGAFGDGATGTVFFDNLTLVRNPKVRTFEGERFILHLYDDQVELATRAAVEQTMANIDRVCEAYTDLTGYDPGTEKQSAWAPDKWNIGALGWSGNPVLWSGDRHWIGENWAREGYCAEVFLHELGHNWDHWKSTFHGHFCELKMAYALETLNLGIAEDGWTRGKDTRHRWEFRSRRNRELGICDELVQTYRNLQIVDQVGWEPVKQTYRYFLALPDDQVPPDAWGKFRLWHDKVTEFSGFDAWSVYTPDEVEYARGYYAPRPDRASLPKLAGIAPDVREVSLTGVQWESAETGWEEPRYGIYGSADRWHADSIYAHAVSRYVYALGGQWKAFHATCGLARGNPGSVVFVAKADGREVFRSEVVKGFAEQVVGVDVAGAQSLELIVEDGGDGKNSDHGVWFSPRLTR